MASTFVNDLRLTELATGDASGTWGNVTNTNLELIAEAFSFGTEAITTNADTHTSTIADGATDPLRSMYVKYTGTLDSACTITLAPNTLSKLWFIENATSGSQNIILTQGSGANVTIPNGQTKVVATDGAGSGAVVYDVLTDLNLAGTTVYNALNDGTTTLTTTAAELNIVDGNTSAVSTTLLDADRLVANDAGVMKQVALTNIKTYLTTAGFSTDDPTALAIALG